jgi:Ni/Co efflux regulator RcnB
MRRISLAVISLFCAALVSPAMADNDKNKGGGHGGGHKAEKADKHDKDKDKGRGNSGRGFEQRAIVGPAGGTTVVAPHQQIVVVDRDRTLVRTYYRDEYVAGRCPPGLAKKNNGCLPPGQAKKMWTVGQPLPPGVIYYPIHGGLRTQLTPPPYGYEYVQVDDNIVLIATASRVIAALLANVGSFD